MKPLPITKVLTAEYARTIHTVVPPEGTPFEDLLRPDYWAHVATRFRPSDRIEVLAEDGSYFAELLITDVSTLWAKVAPLRYVDLVDETEEEASPVEEYTVKWGGPVNKYRVIRKSDNAVIQENFANKADANRFIVEHNRAMAA